MRLGNISCQFILTQNISTTLLNCINDSVMITHTPKEKKNWKKKVWEKKNLKSVA